MLLASNTGHGLWLTKNNGSACDFRTKEDYEMASSGMWAVSNSKQWAFSLFSPEFTDTSITNTDRHVLPQNWRFEIRSRVFPGRLVV